jgi:hypothetical protein
MNERDPAATPQPPVEQQLGPVQGPMTAEEQAYYLQRDAQNKNNYQGAEDPPPRNEYHARDRVERFDAREQERQQEHAARVANAAAAAGKSAAAAASAHARIDRGGDSVHGHGAYSRGGGGSAHKVRIPTIYGYGGYGH